MGHLCFLRLVPSTSQQGCYFRGKQKGNCPFCGFRLRHRCEKAALPGPASGTAAAAGWTRRDGKKKVGHPVLFGIMMMMMMMMVVVMMMMMMMNAFKGSVLALAAQGNPARSCGDVRNLPS